MPDDARLEADLCDAILTEMLIASGRAPAGPARRLLGPLLRPPARRFARLMAGTDRRVAQGSMTAGAQWLLAQLVDGVDVRGADRIPTTGPVLIVSNHPGAYDSAAIVAHLPPRPDLMMLASDIAFLRRLPAIGAHLIYVSPDREARKRIVPAMIRHLAAGGALLTYGTGLVDPDPDLLPGAREALAGWRNSLATVLQQAPQSRLVVAIASSVLAREYLRSPFARLKRDGWERRKLAEFLQVGSQLVFSRKPALRPRVSFGRPVAADELRAEPGGPITTQAIVARATELLAEHMKDRHCEGDSPKQ